MLALGRVETADPFSWTSAGAPWLNHEVLAEIALGWVHRAGGATGLWAVTLAVSALTLAFALLESRREKPERGLVLTGCALLAASTNSLALGFSARPQLFTLLALVLLLGLLRRIHAGSRAALIAMPLLFCVWMYTHGGVLAGLVLTGVAAAATLGQLLVARTAFGRFFGPSSRGEGTRMAAGVILAATAMLCIPHGPEMLRWLVASVSYARPEITEWRPTPLDLAHATFFFTVALSVAAWIASRRERRAWEAAVLLALLAMALRHQRHIPLFVLANLILTPGHLLDLLRRLRPSATNLVDAFQRGGVRVLAILTLLAGGGAAVAKSFAAPREHPCSIEVERGLFPCAALEFLRGHPLEGTLLVFFDWGQQAMWELPRNRVSFDGRFDTVYPRTVIDAHWRFYRGESANAPAPDLLSADIALLPTSCGGVQTLLNARWTPVYVDPLAIVLVREPHRHASLRGQTLPVRRDLEAVQGRELFPEQPSSLARP
jgi:hypothetical protein